LATLLAMGILATPEYWEG